MQKNTTLQLDTLLNSELSPSIEGLSNYSDKIEMKLVENDLIFKKVINSLMVDGTDVNKAISDRVRLLEEQIQQMVPSSALISVEALKSKVNELFLFLEAASKVGCYLKEEAAAMLLDKMPPVNLLTLETELLTSLTSLEKISLTRHSESQTWQSNYLKLLEALPADAFETRPVNHNIIDKRKFAQIMDTSDMKQKPWRMSHAKETGFVNIFTHDSDSILGGTPSIQFVTVLFHYYYETLYAGQFSLSNSEADRSRLLAQVISTREDKFPFFHPNCYTEHLYWKHALESFTLYTKDHLDVSFFAHTLSCGGYLNESDPNGPISLNLIDHIWNLNIVNDIEKQSYFQFSNSSFLYHFREGLWYEILLDMVGTSSEEMQAYLKSHLHLGDQALTRAILLKK